MERVDVASSGLASSGSERLWLWLVGVSIAATALPILAVRIPPLSDYPGHLARYWVLAGGYRSPEVAAMFVVDWSQAWTNIVGDLVVVVTHRLDARSGGGIGDGAARRRAAAAGCDRAQPRAVRRLSLVADRVCDPCFLLHLPDGLPELSDRSRGRAARRCTRAGAGVEAALGRCARAHPARRCDDRLPSVRIRLLHRAGRGAGLWTRAPAGRLAQPARAVAAGNDRGCCSRAARAALCAAGAEQAGLARRRQRVDPVGDEHQGPGSGCSPVHSPATICTSSLCWRWRSRRSSS